MKMSYFPNLDPGERTHLEISPVVDNFGDVVEIVDLSPVETMVYAFSAAMDFAQVEHRANMCGEH